LNNSRLEPSQQLQYMAADLCQICMEHLDDPLKQQYTLSQCNHQFHTDCIVNWFRNDSQHCVACNPTLNHANMNHATMNPANAQVNYDLYGLPYITFQQPNIQPPFAIVSRQARKKDAPEGLKKLYKQYQQARVKFATANKAYRDYRKTDDYPTYRTLRKQFRKKCYTAHRLKRRFQFRKSKLLDFHL
jgi:hypothetical protein